MRIACTAHSQEWLCYQEVASAAVSLHLRSVCLQKNLQLMLYSTILSHPDKTRADACPAPSIQREGYGAYHDGLGGHRWIPAD
jgi:hypothetical protein